MTITDSACGIYQCAGCAYVTAGRCLGCLEGNIRLREAKQDVCAVFACVEGRDISNCDDCTEPSCALKRSVESICPLRSRFEKQRWWAGRMSRALEHRKRQSESAGSEAKPSERVVSRLRWYLTALDSFTADGHDSFSSWQLAEKVGVNAALIRKDLSRFGEFGTPSYGYRIDYLRERIMSILGLDTPKAIVWVGACALRHHTGAIERLCGNNCNIVAVFDTDKHEIGSRVGEYTVLSADAIGEVLCGVVVDAAIIAVPGPHARVIANTMVEHGAKAVLNLSGQLMVLPDTVRVCSFDLVGELLELCYYCDREGDAVGEGEAVREGEAPAELIADS